MKTTITSLCLIMCTQLYAFVFNPVANYTPGSKPTSILSGDLNADGKLDLVVSNAFSNTISVFINNGNGTFASKVDYTTASVPYGIAIGDLNADGKADIAVVNNSSTSVSVFINSGTGTFATKVDYTTGTLPRGVVIGDLNGDSKPDLVVSNEVSNTISVLINSGTGTFATKVDYATANNPFSIAIGDLNVDGKLDVAVTNYLSNSVSVFINNGSGTFAAKVDYATAANPHDIALGDLNNDGKPDLAMANVSSDVVSVLINNGTGTFATKVDYATGNHPRGVVIGDLNGDSKPDIATSNEGTNTISVFANSGTGTFGTKVDFAGTAPTYIAIGDFNGDCDKDLAFTSFSVSGMGVLINNNQSFVPKVSSQVPTGNIPLCIGENYTMSVAATGASPITYQWIKNSSTNVGTSVNNYTIINPQAANVGETYYCHISNGCGSINSTQFQITGTKTVPTGAVYSNDNWISPLNQTFLAAGCSSTDAVSDWYLVSSGSYVGQSNCNGGILWVAGHPGLYGTQYQVRTYTSGCVTSPIVTTYTASDMNPYRKELDIYSDIDPGTILYPNPASTSVDINTPAEKSKVQIVNSLGSLVLTTEVSGQKTVDISSLAPGIYLVNIIEGSDIITKKLKVIK